MALIFLPAPLLTEPFWVWFNREDTQRLFLFTGKLAHDLAFSVDAILRETKLKRRKSSISGRISRLSPRRIWFFFCRNIRFRNYRVRDSLQHEVRNEESCRFILSGRRAALRL
jgi:hypothetical protein